MTSVPSLLPRLRQNPWDSIHSEFVLPGERLGRSIRPQTQQKTTASVQHWAQFRDHAASRTRRRLHEDTSDVSNIAGSRDVRLRSSKKFNFLPAWNRVLGRKTGLLPSNCIRRNQQRCAVLKIMEVIRVPPPPVLERNEDRIWSTGA